MIRKRNINFKMKGKITKRVKKKITYWIKT